MLPFVTTCMDFEGIMLSQRKTNSIQEEYTCGIETKQTPRKGSVE